MSVIHDRSNRGAPGSVRKEPSINATLRQREKDAALARGEEWIDPEELDRREQEEAERRHEEDHIKDLKEHCTKRRLDFETENLKYLKKTEVVRLLLFESGVSSCKR